MGTGRCVLRYVMDAASCTGQNISLGRIRPMLISGPLNWRGPRAVIPGHDVTASALQGNKIFACCAMWCIPGASKHIARPEDNPPTAFPLMSSGTPAPDRAALLPACAVIGIARRRVFAERASMRGGYRRWPATVVVSASDIPEACHSSGKAANYRCKHAPRRILFCAMTSCDAECKDDIDLSR